MMEGQGNDERFQGSLDANDDEENENEQDQLEALQNAGLDLNSMLSGLLGGQKGGASVGLDLGALLGGLMGGMGGDNASGMPGLGSLGGPEDNLANMPFGDIVGSVASDLSQKTGLPKEIISMGAMFLISKLMMGGATGAQQPDGQPAGGLDLGALLGGILGGAMPGMSADPAGQDDSDMLTPQSDDVFGKIGQQIGEGLNSPQLTAGGLQQSGLASEFADMSGMSEEDAAQSLSKIADALKQGGLGQ